MLRVCIVQPAIGVPSETFLEVHARRLPARVTVVHGDAPRIGDRAVLGEGDLARGWRKALRMLRGDPWEREITVGYMEAFRRVRPDVVLAEYGTTGARVVEACRETGVPLVVHFHGYDAYVTDVLAANRERYARLFRVAGAVIAVSSAMVSQLVAIGAPVEKVVYNPYGIDCGEFQGASPAEAEPVFLSVGRFVEKKAPELTILAFANVCRRYPAARLRMIGDGALLGPCRDVATALGVAGAVDFLGTQGPAIVRDEMRRARAFVQHSVRASNGDSEGTPVAILEAGASGLPVVATRHAGIPEAVEEGRTGFLVDERDVAGMAEHMLRLAADASLAAKLGAAATGHVRTNYPIQRSIARLQRILTTCAA